MAGAAASALIAAASTSALAQNGNVRLNAIFDGLSEALLTDQPEGATFLGLDKGRHAELKARLADQSWAHVSKDHEMCGDWMTRLIAIPDAGLSSSAALNKAVVVEALRVGRDGGNFKFGNNTLTATMNESTTPYVVNQENGSFVSVPEFLDSQHRIETKYDADAYVGRVEQFATVLDQETERVKRDAGLGVIPPSFILSTAIGQIEAFLKMPAASQRLVSSLTTRTRKKGITEDYAAQMTKLVAQRIYPAVARQLDALKANVAKATADAGVWKLEDGQAYYAWLLEVGTTTTMTADQIHKMGLEQNAELESRMDVLLKKQGITKGSVGDRMTALSKDARFLFPETDAGREEIIAHLNKLIAITRTQMPKLSALKLKAPVVVKRVPPDIQNGAPQGYMSPGSLDGTRPSIYYINLKTNSNWPRYSLPTLTHHETIPGHAWQGAYITESHAFPLVREILSGFNAYVEGWALYAEQLTDEIGMYADDPFGQLGYLAAQKMRAGRLVVDTGLHAKRWTREQAINWFQRCTGDPRLGVESEVDRYCSTPGQACGYKVGHSELLRLRGKMKDALSARFDLREFNDAVVKAGAVPLTVLASMIETQTAALQSK
jgi:uncharacterized protein (DUF885 family)